MTPLDFIASLTGEAKAAALTVYNLMTPQWTEITDDPATLPPLDEPVKPPFAECYECERQTQHFCDYCATCLLCCDCDDDEDEDEEEEEDEEDDDDTA
jgi:hypothetical protein